MICKLDIRQASTTKRRAKNKLLVHLPARNLKLDVHTNHHRHMMPLWLTPWVRTQNLSWWHQKVDRCANVFSSPANCVSFNSCEHELGGKSRGVISVILLKQSENILHKSMLLGDVLGKLGGEFGACVRCFWHECRGFRYSWVFISDTRMLLQYSACWEQKIILKQVLESLGQPTNRSFK